MGVPSTGGLESILKMPFSWESFSFRRRLRSHFNDFIIGGRRWNGTGRRDEEKKNEEKGGKTLEGNLQGAEESEDNQGGKERTEGRNARPTSSCVGWAGRSRLVRRGG
ncbi:UNVERIFIED_CONTAM: hypothetical protein K2H54_056240 [Gekko kuhli]